MGQLPSQLPPPGTIKGDLPSILSNSNYPSGEQHAAALLTVSGETHLVQGGPNFLQAPAASRWPTRPPLHARSLAPAIITAIRSAFPDVSYMEYKGLANEITELVNSCEKESHQHFTQQEHWIEGLQNHVRELYTHIESARHALQAVSSGLEIHGLIQPGSAIRPNPHIEPFGLYQSTGGEATPASAVVPSEPSHPF